MKPAFSALLLTVFASLAFAEESPVGFQSSTLTDARSDRPLEIVVWYPAATSTTPQMIGDDVVFIGAPAIHDAAPATGQHPLVVLSHGYRGNWHNQIWLASALAQKGYIVAAVNHPGTTTHNLNPQAAAQLWLRPDDVRRVIDRVTAQPEKFDAVADKRIAVVGHSLGGWTALEIAGARFDPQLFARDCEVHKQLASCGVYGKINPATTPESNTELAGDWRDKRVTAIVSLDLGLSRGLTDQSLAALPVPTLVIAAGAPSQDLPAQLESADLAKRLPANSSRYVEIGDASHFSFMSRCKPGAEEMLEEDVPGDGVICRDGEKARPREEIQAQVVGLVSEFLAQGSARK